MDFLVAGGATPADFLAARQQMAFTLGFHIVLASIGIGLPALTVLAEWRSQRTGDPAYEALARTWMKAAGVLFAVGAVSGTVLSFEMGTLWPNFMKTYGQVFGAAFSMEGIAFFIEAIFMGIYLYGWDRLSPRAHLLTGIPVVISGLLSAFFVVCVNSWMNQPQGFKLVNGEVTDVQPLRAMFNPATPPQAAHLILASLMVCGFVVASVYALPLLRGSKERYHRLGFAIPFTMAAVITPIQLVVGDWAVRFVADRQPIKFAAMEGIDVVPHGGYGWAFGLSSVLTPFCFGAVAASVALAEPWLSPVGLYAGLLTTGLCAYLAAVYLTWDSRRLAGTSQTTERFRSYALITGGLVGALAVPGAIVLGVRSPLLILSVIAGLISLVLLVRRRYLAVRISSALAVVAVLWGAADLASLDLDGTAATDSSLQIVFIALGVGALFLVPSLTWLYILFQRPAPEIRHS